jgi:flavin reductase
VTSVATEQVLRAASRQFATGVTVLTAWHGDEAHGTTASAVSTVSHDPLMLGICLNSMSSFARLAAEAGRFAVNVLAARQAELAGWFADPGRPRGLRQFDHFDWEADPFSGAPLIGGCLAGLGCLLTSAAPVGDHRLLVAEVVTARARPGVPLLSHGGGLHDAVLLPVPRRCPHPAASVFDHLEGHPR